MATLLSIVGGVKGCQMANLTYVSDCKFPKYLGLGETYKRVKLQCQINYSYQNAVNNRLLAKWVAEGNDKKDFVRVETESLPWGEWEIENKVISHKGERYLRFYTFSGASVNVEYFIDNRPATDDELAIIKKYEDSKTKESKKQSGFGLTEHQVQPKNVKFSGIEELTCSGVTFKKDSMLVA